MRTRNNSVRTIEAKDACNIRTNELEEPPERVRIVIVGAGLAGLAAAERLYRNGIEDFILLDGQSRVGGRVFTVSHGDYLLELGAQWLHGADENPLYGWCNEMNMLNDFEEASLGMAGVFCNNLGCEIERELVQKFLDIMVEIKLALSKNEYADLIEAKNFKNAAQVFKHQLDLRLEEFSKNQDEQTNRTLGSLFDWFMRYESIENCCDSMEHVSITSYTDYSDFSDGALLNFKHGYRSLLEWFCNQIPAERVIHLNRRVVGVDVGPAGSGPGRILVEYESCKNNSDNVISRIECQHVIITSSLGFLKKHAQTLFKQPLPRVKMELINSIGFGTVNKIILQFETRFWREDHGIKLVWQDQPNENGHSSRFEGNSLPEWTRDIIAFDSVRKQSNLLIGWIGGLGAKAMELESDSKIGQICLQLLEKFLPEGYNKPSRLIGCVCSRWHSNPFTLGSYSFQSMESFDKNVEQLHEPIYEDDDSKNNPKILFAGEATAGDLYSTAHGAVISGWREADRLRNFYLLLDKGDDKIDMPNRN